MVTKFIGYKRKNGNFTDAKTGELVEYDNYDLYFISSDVPGIHGYYPSEYRVKGESMPQVLANPKLTSREVCEMLSSYMNKDVILSVISVDDKPVVTYLSLSPTAGK